MLEIVRSNGGAEAPSPPLFDIAANHAADHPVGLADLIASVTFV